MTMAEEIVEGQEITLELLNKVAELVEKEVSPITDVRSTEEYRRAVSGVLARRALQAAYDRSQ
jgi:carbon-monoxide dehydrogenase medium subunit